jgi:DNA primase
MNNLAETVRNSADIVRVVSDYVSLKGAGTAFKGLCPFHSEKTPSFSVHRERQIFHCFGCGAGGDVFEFVKLAERVSFPEALQIVAEKCGIPLPAEGSRGAEDRKVEERKRLLELHEHATAHFCRMLATSDGAAARQVLENRRINATYVERFQLGYAPASGLMAVLRPADPIATGLFVRNDSGEIYDRFRRRLMFPIWNERGKTIAFGGRALGDAQPKYLNSAESPLYTKSFVLYGLHLARDAARKAGRIVVVEGYFDCLSLHQNGIENVVASCGTSLTEQQAALMARYVPEVVMNYDPDAAGRSAMRRSIELLLAKGLRIRVLKLPGNLDPDDFVRKEGGQVYSTLLYSAPSFWQYLMDESAAQHDLDRPDLKADAVRDVVQSIAKIRDRVEQLEVARAVAEGYKLPESLILEQLRISPRRPEPRTAVPAARLQAQRRLTDSEKQLIHGLLQVPERARDLEPFLTTGFLSEVWSRRVVEELIKDPGRNVEMILESVEDEELRKAVRAAVLEPFGTVSNGQVRASVAQLYDSHLVKMEKEVREQLKHYGPGTAAPAELVRKQAEIAAEKLRLRAMAP